VTIPASEAEDAVNVPAARPRAVPAPSKLPPALAILPTGVDAVTSLLTCA